MSVQLASVEVPTSAGSASAREHASGTTTTYPPRLPQPEADYFDRGHLELPAPRSAALLEDVEIGDYRLTMPLLVSIEYRDGFYEIEHQELAVFGRGRTTADAVADFLDYLIADYHAYAGESDENMDKYARELARRYRRLFKSR